MQHEPSRTQPLNMWLRYCMALLLFLLIRHPAVAQPLEARVRNLWQTYNRLSADSTSAAADVLLGLNRCYILLERTSAADSVTDMLTQRVRMSADDDLQMRALDLWMTNLDWLGLQPVPFADTSRVAGIVRSLTAVARRNGSREWHAQAWCASARYIMGLGNYKTALDHTNRAWYAASLTKDGLLKIRCLHLQGYCEEKLLNKHEAFRRYADALYLAQHDGNVSALARCYVQLCDFYIGLSNYEKAEESLYKTFPLLSASRQVDSVLYMQQLTDLVYLQSMLKEYDAALQTARSVMKFSLRTGNRLLKRGLLATVKSVLMEAGEYARLKDFYTRSFPGELQAVAAREPAGYYQLRAAFAEADGQPDTAEHYYKLAGQKIISPQRPAAPKAFFLRRFGHFLLRSGKPEQARPVLDSALRFATEINYLPYMTELSEELDTLWAATGNTAEAYHYAKRSKKYSEALTAANRQDEILMLELEGELRSRELMAEREKLQTTRRHNIQYMAILLLIGASFLLLLLLGSFKVPRWAITEMGFFSFIFLFEFIILLIDGWLHHATHGEPWKILAVKIVLIGALSPLHHWLQHRVVHYLHTHQLLDASKFSLRPLIARIRAVELRSWRRGAAKRT